jgi:hypothetical protein
MLIIDLYYNVAAPTPRGTLPMRIDKPFLAKLLGVDASEIASIKGMSFEFDAPDSLISFKSLILDRFRKRMEALADVLSKDDDLGKVIRAHIYIQHELQDFIFFAAPSSDQLKLLKDLDYSGMVGLALVLGLNVELKPALNAIGGLRNRFAHRLDMKIGEEEAKNLVNSLPSQAKQKYQELLQAALSELSDMSSLPPEGRSYVKAQTQMLAFFLRLFDMVAGERHRVAFEKLQGMAWH